MGVVVGMHAALVIVLARSMGLVTLELPTRTEATIIDQLQKRVNLPPPPAGPSAFADPDIVVPKPVVDFHDELPPIRDPIGLEPDGGLIGDAGSAVPVPAIVAPRLDPRRPLSRPAYHPSEIRAGNQGNADVEVYVLSNGRVGDARLLRSSGFERLDRATLEEAKRAWRLIPATRDGVAVPQWYRVRVVFKLTSE